MNYSQMHRDDHSQLSKAKNISITLLSTIISKALSTTINAPLHFVQNRFQVMGQMKRNGLIQHNYKGYISCIKSVIKQENGVAALWKGNLTKILIICFGSFYSLTLGDIGKKYASQYSKNNNLHGLIKSKYFGDTIGIISASLGTMLTYPLQYAYIRLLTDRQSVSRNGQKQFRGMIDVLNSTLKSDGIRGLYRGLLCSVGGILVYRAAYFGLYDYWKNHTDKNNASIVTAFVAGYCITLSAGALAYPISTIRKRMMMRSLQSQKYQWCGQCAKYVYKNQGILAFYRGFPISIVSAIFGSLMIVTYDSFKRNIISS